MEISSEYIDFANIFSSKLVVKLLEHMKINNYAIMLVDDWELSYGPIYSLSFVKLKMLKTYIENNLINSFIRSSKSSAITSIFFDKKSNSNLKLCVDY